MVDPESNILTPDKAFVCISLFNLVRLPLAMFPFSLKLFISLLVSMRRITDFLNADELHDCLENKSLPDKETNAVEVKTAFFSWSDSKKPTLKDIDFEIPKGSLTAIVGVVGSGKSSLLQAILGEMEMISGNVKTNGTISFVPQQAWIQNLSLKDNILFSQPYQKQRYQNIVRACALEADLNILSNGDQTEIGENGINLSGGQKQRVALARAMYSDNEIFLLGDSYLISIDTYKHWLKRIYIPIS